MHTLCPCPQSASARLGSQANSVMGTVDLGPVKSPSCAEDTQVSVRLTLAGDAGMPPQMKGWVQ